MFLTLLPFQVWAMQSSPMTDTEKFNIIKQEWESQEKLPEDAPLIIQNKNIKKDKEVLPKEFFNKITIKAQDLELSEILKILDEVLGYHSILAVGVEDKKISVDLTNVTVIKALNTILFPLGYSFKVKDGDLIILATETRIYQIVLPPLIQNFSDVTSNESSIESSNTSNNNSLNNNTINNNQQIKLGTKILVSNESSKVSFWDDVSENLKSLITPLGKFSINRPAGVVIVTDNPLNLERIGQYFDNLSKRVTQQIEVDVKVVEVSLDKENHFGIDWNALASNLKTLNSLGLTTNFATQNFTNGSFLRIAGKGSKPGSGIAESGISIIIDALAKQGRVEVVSQPRIKILNNQLAVIQVGSTQSFVDNSTVQVTQTGTITTLSTSEVQEGVTMRLLGNIVGDEIYLSVAPVITTIDKIRPITSGNTTIEAPQTTTKSINTLVRVKEGESVAIGGLITSNHEKSKQEAPIISKIPLLGKLFQYNQEINHRKELVIFITPKKA